MKRILLLSLSSAAIALAALPAAAEDSELTVFDWSGYEEPQFHPAYTAKNGDSPTFSFFGDEDEAFAKLRAGFKADIAHPCSQSVAKWRDAGMLEPLDPAKLENWNDVLPGIKAMKNFTTTDDGKIWAMPFEWGNTTILYKTDTVKPDEVASLRAFADPKFKGRVSIPDGVDDAYALASLAIGLKDWTKMTDAQFAEASAFLREVHKNVAVYWADNTDLAQAMTSGGVDLAWGWPETYTTLKKDNQPIAISTAAKEGFTTWVCAYVHLKGGAGKEDKVYDYINAVSSPDISQYLLTDWGYGHGNGKGMAAIDPKLVEASGLADISKYVDNTLFQQPVPVELKGKWIAEFEKIKAGF